VADALQQPDRGEAREDVVSERLADAQALGGGRDAPFRLFGRKQIENRPPRLSVPSMEPVPLFHCLRVLSRAVAIRVSDDRDLEWAPIAI
jgi:hypothetical protein